MASTQHMETIDRRLAELGQLDPVLAGTWQDMIAQLAYDDILTDHRAGIVIAALAAAIDTALAPYPYVCPVCAARFTTNTMNCQGTPIAPHQPSRVWDRTNPVLALRR